MTTALSFRTHLAAIFVATLCMVASFAMFAPRAGAQEVDALFPRITETTQLVLNTVHQQLTADAPLMQASSAQQQAQIQSLLGQLQSLLARYNQLRAQGVPVTPAARPSSSTPAPLSTTPVTSVPVTLRGTTGAPDATGSVFLTLDMVGYQQNKSVYKWVLDFACDTHVSVLGKVNEDLCGTKSVYFSQGLYDATRDYTLLTVPVVLAANAKNQSVVFTLTAFSANDVALGTDTFRVHLLGADTKAKDPSVTITYPTGGENFEWIVAEKDNVDAFRVSWTSDNLPASTRVTVELQNSSYGVYCKLGTVRASLGQFDVPHSAITNCMPAARKDAMAGFQILLDTDANVKGGLSAFSRSFVLSERTAIDSGALKSPVLVSVTPERAKVGTQAEIVLVGSNFTQGAVVQYVNETTGSSGILQPTSVTSRVVKLNVVPGSAGTMRLSVKNPDGGLSGTLRVIVEGDVAKPVPPVLAGISPSYATVGIPTTFTLTGINFMRGAVVQYTNISTGGSGTLVPDSITNVTSNMTLTVTPGAAGTLDISVKNPDGLSSVKRSITISPQ